MKTKVILSTVFCYLLCNWSVKGQATVDGEIIYEDFGLVVGYIDLIIYVDPLGDICNPETADMYGQFACSNLDCQSGSVNTVGISPTSPNDYVDGVTGADVTLLQQYLNTGTGFDNYDKIAADPQNDQDVDINDKNTLRDLVLAVITSFTAPSWRFITIFDKSTFESASYASSYNYLIDYGYFGTYEKSGLSQTQITNEFWDIHAIKIGDLNGSHPEIRATVAPARISTNAILAGEEVELLFTANHFHDIQAYQFGMHIDPAYLEVISIEDADLPQLTAKNFGDRIKEKGELRTLWYEDKAKPVSLPDGATLFKIKAKALQPISNLQNVLQIDEKILPTEFVANAKPTDGVELEVKLKRSESPITPKDILVYPNPAFENSKIGFVIDLATQVNLTLHDVNGRVLENYQADFSAGYNEFVLEDLNKFSSGILFFTLDTGFYTSKGKIIKK
jgi:hypothetical protein